MLICNYKAMLYTQLNGYSFFFRRALLIPSIPRQAAASSSSFHIYKTISVYDILSCKTYIRRATTTTCIKIILCKSHPHRKHRNYVTISVSICTNISAITVQYMYDFCFVVFPNGKGVILYLLLCGQAQLWSQQI